MQLLAEALAADGTSQSFKAEQRGWVVVKLLGTFDGATVTMQESLDDSAFTTFTPDKNAATFTAASTEKFYLSAGTYYRFDVENTGTVDIDIYIDGEYVEELS